LSRLSTTTDFNEAIKLVKKAKDDGTFLRSFNYNRSLGLESFRLPYETDEVFAPDVNYPYKDMVPTKVYALWENIALVRDAVIALELYLVKVLALGVQYKEGKTSLLQEKMIKQITEQYKR
jgi:hypothetical protein